MATEYDYQIKIRYLVIGDSKSLGYATTKQAALTIAAQYKHETGGDVMIIKVTRLESEKE